MKALVLTWEFPPYISGGLGMACYGLFKAMLALGNTEVDLVLPSTEDVHFPLRNVEDVDTLPMSHMNPRKALSQETLNISSLTERLKAVGVSFFPTSYITPGINFEKDYSWITSTFTQNKQEIDLVKTHLKGDESLFKSVQEYTIRAIRNAPNLSCDVIHCHDWLTYPAAIALKNILKKPLVAHIHATEFDRAGGPGDHRIHNIEYAGLSAADRVIAVSQYTAQMIIDRYCINPHKIRVVHNAYSVPSLNTQRRKLFRDPLVLFLGRVTLQKGPDYFLEVAKRVIERFSNVRFVMAGSGDMFYRIMRGAAGKRLKDRFLFTGFLNRDQVERILSAADIFVLPSVSEPFGIAPLEAMSYGSVAIISKQSGVAEVIKNAYKVDFWDMDKTADIIVHLLENPKEMERMSRKGREEVLDIEWKAAAEKTLNVYKEVACST